MLLVVSFYSVYVMYVRICVVYMERRTVLFLFGLIRVEEVHEGVNVSSRIISKLLASEDTFSSPSLSSKTSWVIRVFSCLLTL